MSLKLFPTKRYKCCNADATFMTSMKTMRRGMPPVECKDIQVHHVRGSERFWHWSDKIDSIVRSNGYGLGSGTADTPDFPLKG